MSELAKKIWKQKKRQSSFLSIPENDTINSGASVTSANNSSVTDKHLLEEVEIAEQLFSVQDTYEHILSSTLFQTYYCPPSDNSLPVLFCHHGGGSSAMTFWCLAQNAKQEYGYGTFSYDARGHGDTKLGKNDILLSTLSEDLAFILCEFKERHNHISTICLVGHSLGGSVFSHFLQHKYDQTTFPKIEGLVVIDIVGDTALQALNSTEAFINKMPTSFSSYSEAIQWHLDSGLLNNYESAKISVCHLLRYNLSQRLVWKCNPKSLPDYWNTWFVDMSSNFINGSHGVVSKILLLSSDESLDKELMIGQMQGRYQLVVFNNTLKSGHFLHEDIPRQLLLSILDFTRRIKMKQKLEICKKWGNQQDNSINT